jgi:hypothetical protein
MGDSRRYPFRNNTFSTASLIRPCLNRAIIANQENVGSIVAVDVAKSEVSRETPAFVEHDASETVYFTEALPGVFVALACVTGALEHTVVSHDAKVCSPVSINIADMYIISDCD